MKPEKQLKNPSYSITVLLFSASLACARINIFKMGKTSMKPLAMDTDEWAERKQLELIRAATPAKRLNLALQLSAFSWNAARSAIDRLHPTENQEQRDHRFLELMYGQEIANRYRAWKRTHPHSRGEST